MTDNLRESIGRAAHEAARRVLVEQGYAPHPLTPIRGQRIPLGAEPRCQLCASIINDDPPHSRDMVDWAELPEERRAYFRAVGLAGAVMRDHLRDLLRAARAYIPRSGLVDHADLLAEIEKALGEG